MLDHHHRVPGIHQPVQDVHQLFDISHGKADRRLIQHVERVRQARRTPGCDDAFGHACLGKLGHQFDPLRLAAGQRGGGLPEREVAQPHILHQLQWVAHARVCGEVADRVVDLHRENFAGMALAQPHAERVGIEARAAAGVAGHLDIGQEAHFQCAHALTLAYRTASVARIERETTRPPAADARLVGVGELFAHVVPEADVGRRARARRLADRGLVDLEHAVDGTPSIDATAPAPARVRAAGDRGAEIVEQHLACECRFAGARDTGYDRQVADRDAGVDMAQVVKIRAFDRDDRRIPCHRAPRICGMRQRMAQIVPGRRLGRRHDVLQRAFGHDAPAPHACAWPDIDDVLGSPDRVVVVLDHDQRVAVAFEPRQRLEQDAVVARVQPDGGFVQHVADSLQVGAELCGEPDALRLATGERRCAAIKRQVA